MMTENVALIDRDDQGAVLDQPALPNGQQKRSFHNRKIQRAIDDEIAGGGSLQTLDLLTPAERRRRLNEHLKSGEEFANTYARA